MKNYLLFLFFALSSADLREKLENKINSGGKAIASLIHQLSDQYQMQFHIVTINGDVTSKHIANKIVSFHPSSVYLEDIFNITEFEYTFGVSYVLLTKKGILLELSKKRELPNLPFINRTFTSYGFSLLLNYAYDDDGVSTKRQGQICTQNDFPFQPSRMYQLSHSNRNSKTSLKLFNCVMFQKHKCEAEWKTINVFYNSKWKFTKFLLNYKRFNYCTINFVLNIWDSTFPAIIDARSTRSRDNLVVIGLIGDFFRVFARSAKMMLKFTEQAYSKNWWDYELDYDFAKPNIHPHSRQHIYAMEPTLPLLYTTYTFMVTPGAKLSPVENLYMPFDWQIWISFGSSILIGLVCILIIRMFPNSVRNFVFGQNNKDPILNMTQIFFGIGLVKVSIRNFARYLFMMFTLYCLIIRNAYQGKMFEFITGDLRHPTAETLQDIIDMKLPFLVPTNLHFFQHLKHQNYIYSIYNINTLKQMVFEQHDYGNQTFALWIGRVEKTILQGHKLFIQRLYETGMTVLNQDYDFSVENILIKPESYLCSVLNDFIYQWYEHGFNKHHQKINLPSSPIVDTNKDPKVLTMHMLSAGFYLWSATVLIACFVFIAEHVVSYFASFRRSEREEEVEVYEDELEYDVLGEEV